MQTNGLQERSPLLTLGNTPELSVAGVRTWARLLSVYDGDTVTLDVPCHGSIYRFSARIEGIDTPEMKGPHKDKALLARNRLCQLLGLNVALDDPSLTQKHIQALLLATPAFVWVECGGFDKYGRLLVKAFANAESTEPLGDVLIREGQAYAYDGGTKRQDP